MHIVVFAKILASFAFLAEFTKLEQFFIKHLIGDGRPINISGLARVSGQLVIRQSVSINSEFRIKVNYIFILRR